MGSLSIPEKAEAIAPYAFTYRSYYSSEGHHEAYIFSWVGLDGSMHVYTFRFLNGEPGDPPTKHYVDSHKGIFVENDSPIQYLSVKDNRLIIEGIDDYTIKIFNISGNLLFETKNIKNKNIDLNNLKDKLLFLQLSTQNYINTQKIIK